MVRKSNDGTQTLDQAIWSIVDDQDVTDQQSFLKVLATLGFSMNQSTLSRHLRKLGIRKQNGVYKPVEMEQAGQVNPNLVLEVMTSPPNLLLVKTLPGHANAVGYHLETNDIMGIAGTVAGNDTLMVAMTSPDLLDTVRAEIIRTFKLEDK